MIRTIWLLTIVSVILSLKADRLYSQEYKVLEVRNCQHEMRVFTFQSQVSYFWKWAYYDFHMPDIAKQKVLHFSSSYTVDSPFIRSQIEKIRKSVPPGFFNLKLTDIWYDNEPDDSTIWFTIIFAKKAVSGNIAYAAYRITFEGNNAQIEEQRINPRIRNIEFIYGKVALTKLMDRIKVLPPTRG
jgi:hypothetical protein